MKANIAESKDIKYIIEILKVLRDKHSNPEFEYTRYKIVPSINRMILELESMEGSEI